MISIGYEIVRLSENYRYLFKCCILEEEVIFGEDSATVSSCEKRAPGGGKSQRKGPEAGIS